MKAAQGQTHAWGFHIASISAYIAGMLHAVDGESVAAGVFLCAGALMFIAALLTERLR